MYLVSLTFMHFKLHELMLDSPSRVLSLWLGWVGPGIRTFLLKTFFKQRLL